MGYFGLFSAIFGYFRLLSATFGYFRLFSSELLIGPLHYVQYLMAFEEDWKIRRAKYVEQKATRPRVVVEKPLVAFLRSVFWTPEKCAAPWTAALPEQVRPVGAGGGAAAPDAVALPAVRLRWCLLMIVRKCVT